MPVYPGGLPYESTHISVMFRYANVVQSVSVTGARETVTVGDLMEIAGRKLAKIRAPVVGSIPLLLGVVYSFVS